MNKSTENRQPSFDVICFILVTFLFFSDWCSISSSRQIIFLLPYTGHHQVISRELILFSSLVQLPVQQLWWWWQRQCHLTVICHPPSSLLFFFPVWPKMVFAHLIESSFSVCWVRRANKNRAETEHGKWTSKKRRRRQQMLIKSALCVFEKKYAMQGSELLLTSKW